MAIETSSRQLELNKIPDFTIAQAGKISAVPGKSYGSGYKIDKGIITVRHVVLVILDDLKKSNPKEYKALEAALNQENKKSPLYISNSFSGGRIGLDGTTDGAMLIPNSIIQNFPKIFSLLKGEDKGRVGSIGIPPRRKDIEENNPKTLKFLKSLTRKGSVSKGNYNTQLKPGDSGSQLVDASGKAYYSAIIGTSGGGESYYIPNSKGGDWKYLLVIDHKTGKLRIEDMACMEAGLGCA